MKKKLFSMALAIVCLCTLALGLTACESGKSAYELYVKEYTEINGSDDGVLTESEWLNYLKGEEGEAGKSAYELYVKEYIEINGSDDGVLTESEWLSFLKGEEGEAGKSAYELYVKEYTEINGSDDGVLTESEWLSYLKGEEGEAGKSAYELYVKEYIEINGSDDGVLTESEWLNYLKGDTGIGIKEIHIVCGDIVINYDNENAIVLEAVYPEAGHKWDSGEITSKATCITFGVITFTCEECGVKKKELLEETGEHRWGNYYHNDDTHWRVCKICGEEEKCEHDFGDNIIKDNVDAILECECGINQTVGEFFAYKILFECDPGASIIIYETQDYTLGGTASNIAYSRSSDTGELLNNGDGQVNFEVIVNLGYKLKTVTIAQKNYKNLKDSSETGKENTFRITKITGQLIVSVETEIDFMNLPVMIIDTADSAPIKDKENYVNCKISVSNAEEEFCFDNADAGIRGRGNSTWGMPKKPYKLKFDKKIDLFGNGEAKKWTLIANYCDPSLIRNYLAYSIGAEFEGLMDTTTTVKFVELYLNGQYDGVYLVCEQIEVGITRVDIEDDFTRTSNPADMGYLLELDAHIPQEGTIEKDYFIWNDGTYYAIKSPDYEDANENIDYSDYVNYIKNYMGDTWDALCSGNYELLCNFIDVNSFAESFIVHELFKMCDVGYSSFYIYKKQNDKIYSGPIWDFDISSGNCNYNASSNTNTIWSTVQNHWYSKLFLYEEFKQLVSEKLSEYESIIKNRLDSELQYVIQNKNPFLRNFERWNILGVYVWPNTEEIVAIETWEGQVEYLYNWLLDSLDYMVSVYCNNL